MTAERDGKSRRTGQPDLLASLPDERPPASQPAPGIDPASIEELLTEVQDLRNEFAGLKEAVSAERLAPVTLEELREQLAGLRQLDSAERPAPVTPEALEAWDDKLVTRVAEAADTPGEDEVVARLGRIKEKLAELTATVRRLNAKLSSIGNERAAARTADTPGEDAAAARIERIEETAAKAESPAERIDGEPESTADRVAAEIKGMKNVVKHALLTPRNPARSMDYRAERRRTRAPINTQSWPGHGHYEGQYRKGKPAGWSVYTTESDKRYEGNWTNDCLSESDGTKAILLIRDTPPKEMYVLNMSRMKGSRLWGSRLHRACVV